MRMGKATVTLLGALAAVAGERETDIEASTLGQALEALSAKFGEEFTDRLYEAPGRPRRFINIYIDGRDYRFMKLLETKLRGGETIALIPAVSGG